MTTPVRLQRLRTAGYRLQEASRALNGLPAVYVGRAGRSNSRWGNPYKVGSWGHRLDGERVFVADAATAVALHREYLLYWFENRDAPGAASVRACFAELRGKNLACWCAPGEPCHGDTLLEIANGPLCEEVNL